MCVLSEAKKQAPVDSIQKSELTSYIEIEFIIWHREIKLLSNSVTSYIEKREKEIQKECVPPTQASPKLLSKREEKRRETFVQILLLLPCNRATVLSCVSVTPSISLR